MEPLTRYQKSVEMHERAKKVIPLASQTFSKSTTQYPIGSSPLFIKRAKGSHVWDVDGNEYIDFVNSLASITLGYSDPDVDAAVSEQLKDGVIFSLPHPIETLVAEEIRKLVPCAEMIRFGKNGSDATAGAIRLARAYTNREHVAVCGYHGWQDWFIGSTARNRGVPVCTRELTHSFTYNDLSSLKKLFQDLPNKIAAVIMEPMNLIAPKANFLEEVKELAHQHGALLIFDETITGFRYALGGAQEYLKITPDLATFGKGIANGYPLSAVAGRADIMKLMEEVFFSFTFGGETLSLAASLATLKKLQREPVVEQLAKQGQKILSALQSLVQEYHLENMLEVSGHPSWSFIVFKDVAPYTMWQLKSFFMQEAFANGILTIGTHNMSYAHSDDDIKALLKFYNYVFPALKGFVENKNLLEQLKAKPLEPLFKIR